MAFATEKYRILGVYEAGFMYDNSGTAAERPVKFINKVDFTNDVNEVNFEGDQQQERVYIFNGLSASVECDYFDLATLATTFAKAEDTSISGVSSRTYFGETAETTGIGVGFYAKAQAYESVGGVTKNIRIVIPRATISAVEAPNLAYNAKAQLKFKVTASKATTDIAGDALVGVPSGGAFWYFDELT
jgi:hypothetical protein